MIKVKVTKEMTLGELLKELMSNNGVSALECDGRGETGPVGAGKLEKIAMEFYRATQVNVTGDGSGNSMDR